MTSGSANESQAATEARLAKQHGQSAPVHHGYTTWDYRLAVEGEGPLAHEWSDKPHRLVFDLAGLVERLTGELANRDATIDAREMEIRHLQDDLADARNSLDDEMLAAAWDEGYETGCDATARSMNGETDEHWPNPYRAAIPARVDGVDPLPDAPVCGPNMYGDPDVCGCGDQECHGLELRMLRCHPCTRGTEMSEPIIVRGKLGWRNNEVPDNPTQLQIYGPEGRMWNRKGHGMEAALQDAGAGYEGNQLIVIVLDRFDDAAAAEAKIRDALRPAREEPAPAPSCNGPCTSQCGISRCAPETAPVPAPDCANCGHEKERHGKAGFLKYGDPSCCTAYVPAAREDQQ